MYMRTMAICDKVDKRQVIHFVFTYKLYYIIDIPDCMASEIYWLILGESICMRIRSSGKKKT